MEACKEWRGQFQAKGGAGLCFDAFCEWKKGHAGGGPSHWDEARCRAVSKKRMLPFGGIRFVSCDRF
jgi:hypothetical protein